jgi:hypothetical protein
MKNNSNFSTKVVSCKLYAWRIFLLSAILLSLFSILLILRSPSTSDHMFLGLSSERLFITLFLLSASILLLGFLLYSLIKIEKAILRLDQTIIWLSNQPIYGLSAFSLGTVTFLGFYLIITSFGIDDPFMETFLNRLLPILIWLTGISALTILFLSWIKFGINSLDYLPRGKTFYLIMIIIGLIFSAWLAIALENIPLERNHVGLNTIGSPVIGIQVFLAWLAGLGILIYSSYLQRTTETEIKAKRQKILDILLFLILWIFTIILWQSKPIQPSWFISQIRAPNFEYYPTSDARVYDLTSQTALVGEGFIFENSPYIRRPTHAVYMTILHLLAGQDYEKLAFLQVIILALLPPFIYLLTKTIFNRSAAIIAAVLILFREANAISIGGNITTSHAKQFMVDLPMALVVVIFTYIVTLWMKSKNRVNQFALVSGGFLGFILLIRLESFVFILPLLFILAIFLISKRQYSIFLKQSLIFFLGIILVISPWVFRNWYKTGEFFLNSPFFHYQVIQLRYHPPEESSPTQTINNTNTPVAITPTPSSTDQQQAKISPVISTPITVTPIIPTTVPSPPDSVKKEPEISNDPLIIAANNALSYIKSQYREIPSLILTHFLHSQIQTFLVLPTRLQGVEAISGFMAHHSSEKLLEECCSIRYYVRSLPYWKEWDGSFPLHTILPIFGIILIIAFGVNEGWKKNKLISIIPILFWISYILFNALFRNSGGRYILPVDWTGIVYFSIGLAYISGSFIQATFQLNHTTSDLHTQNSKEKLGSQLKNQQFFISIALLLFLLGFMLPIIESNFPQRYTQSKKNLMFSNLFKENYLSTEEKNNLDTFLENGGIMIAGRGIYPRYFPANSGEMGRDKGPLGLAPYPRLVFHMVGPYNSIFTLPLDKKSIVFPSGVDILVFTCPNDDPLAVAVFDSNNTPVDIYFRSPIVQSYSCPLEKVK